jgi:hypothetical protein
VKTVVFLGPSLSRPSAIKILPEAMYLPPARQADVVSAVETHRPDVLALIDGSFGQTLSVWHKELLFALDRGVRVYGAASIGALRAAELAPFGMRGIGEVYRQVAAGELEDDDEVAVVHASAAEDFRPMSEPLVNLRATFTLARDHGVLTETECGQVIAIARRLYFSERTLPSILAAATAQGLAPSTAARLSSFCQARYVDVKRRDAQELLEVIRDLPDPLPEQDKQPSFTFERSASFETLYENERHVPQDGVDLPLRAIADYTALHHPAFDDVNFAALNRALVLVLADQLHVEPGPSDVAAEIQRFRRRRGLDTQPLLARWLAANHLTHEAYEALVRELATARRLHRWLLVRDRGVRRTRWLLDEVRLRGEYAASAAGAAEQHAVLASLDSETVLPDLAETVQLEQLAAHYGRGDAPLATWAEEAGFESAQDLALELLRAERVRERLRAAARALAGAAASSEPP